MIKCYSCKKNFLIPSEGIHLRHFNKIILSLCPPCRVLFSEQSNCYLKDLREIKYINAINRAIVAEYGEDIVNIMFCKKEL